MYIRAVKSKRKTKSKGEISYEYLKLVETHRTAKGPRQKLLLNLGALPLKKKDYKGFVKELEARLTGQVSFLRKRRQDSLVAKMVNETYERLMRKRVEPIQVEKNRTLKTVDIHSHKSSQHRSIGPEYVVHSVWQTLGINQWLKEQHISQKKLNLM